MEDVDEELPPWRDHHNSSSRIRIIIERENIARNGSRRLVAHRDL